MGLFSGLLSAGLSILGRNKERRDAQRDQINKLPRLRESAEKAGFNPLTALLATGGSGFGETNASPPLASMAAIRGTLEGFDDLNSNRRTQNDAQEGAARAIEELRKEQESAGKAGGIVRRTSASVKIPAKVAKLGKGEHTMVAPTSMALPKITGTTKNVDTQNLVLRHIDKMGTGVDVPVGPDIDEIISGAVIGSLAKGRAINARKDEWSKVLNKGPRRRPNNRPHTHRKPKFRGTTAPRDYYGKPGSRTGF